ncbi:MAG: NADPH:quinone reductase-like Zn-dependent oxidoreductase [Arenicella sp.]|jgi:NADPH:quinone reductase-like Zn-dependent oxidoreductase
MKAVIFTEYGNFDSIKLIEKEIPTPKSNEVIVKMKKSSLNAMEWHLFRGVTLVKMKIGWRKPKPKYQTIGADIAGVVTELGAKVTCLKKGDEVFGEDFTGGYAEYTAAKASALTIKPKNVSFEQAAASGVAGLTALTALREICTIKAGDKVLINGASGGVGSYAVLMAKYYGAEVTAVCSAKNFEFVKGLGADHHIDYKTEDFCAQGKKYDSLIEVTGNRRPKEVKSILNDGGKCAVIGFTSAKHIMRYMFSFSKKIKMVNEISSPENLKELATILESGKINMPITSRYKLSEIREGIEHLSTRRATGKVIVDIASE